MEEKKFAVIRINGNEEEVIKLFDLEDKEIGRVYGEEYAKTNEVGSIIYVLAYFDENGNHVGNSWRQFNFWAGPHFEERNAEIIRKRRERFQASQAEAGAKKAKRNR